MIRGAFPPITTRQSFIDSVEVYSDDDDTPFDLTGATIQVAIARQWPTLWLSGSDYGISTDVGSYPAPRLLASTADGSIVIPAIGVFVFTFTAAQIASLSPGQYVIGANMSRSGETVQLILGDLAVLDGVVPQ